MKDGKQQPRGSDGPVRTMRVGQRITVYGDVEIIAIEGRRVQIRVHRASSPPPVPVMFSAKECREPPVR